MRCRACGDIGHFIKFCPTRARQQSSNPAESKAKSTNAVASAGTGAPLLFTEAVIDGVRVRDALVDTGLAFSMLSSVLYEQLPSRPTINRFSSAASEIFGVGGASAEVRGYVDVPLQIAGVEIAHPLLVVTDLSFPLLIGMDVLQLHTAKMSLGHAAGAECSRVRRVPRETY